MAGKRFTAEQIIMKLREAEVVLAQGQTVGQAGKLIGGGPGRPATGESSSNEPVSREPPWSDLVNQQSVSQLGFEPGGLGRHDAARVGDGQELIRRHRRQRECDSCGSRIDRLLERTCSSRPADECHARIGANVGHVEHRRQRV